MTYDKLEDPRHREPVRSETLCTGYPVVNGGIRRHWYCEPPPEGTVFEILHSDCEWLEIPGNTWRVQRVYAWRPATLLSSGFEYSGIESRLMREYWQSYLYGSLIQKPVNLRDLLGGAGT